MGAFEPQLLVDGPSDSTTPTHHIHCDDEWKLEIHWNQISVTNGEEEEEFRIPVVGYIPPEKKNPWEIFYEGHRLNIKVNHSNIMQNITRWL